MKTVFRSRFYQWSILSCQTCLSLNRMVDNGESDSQRGFYTVVWPDLLFPIKEIACIDLKAYPRYYLLIYNLTCHDGVASIFCDEICWIQIFNKMQSHEIYIGTHSLNFPHREPRFTSKHFQIEGNSIT